MTACDEVLDALADADLQAPRLSTMDDQSRLQSCKSCVIFTNAPAISDVASYVALPAVPVDSSIDATNTLKSILMKHDHPFDLCSR